MLGENQAMKHVSIGDQVYVKEGATMFGAVREVHAHGLSIFVENAGDFQVEAKSVLAVHDGKVILDVTTLGPQLRAAIARAHSAEQP